MHRCPCDCRDEAFLIQSSERAKPLGDRRTGGWAQLRGDGGGLGLRTAPDDALRPGSVFGQIDVAEVEKWLRGGRLQGA